MSILGCNCTKNKTEHREEIIISKAVNVAKPASEGWPSSRMAKPDLAITCFADCACGEVVTRLPYEFLVDLVKQYPIENEYKKRLIEAMSRASARSQKLRELMMGAGLYQS